MLYSMTGFAAAQGGISGWSWSWDIRAVNGRGLDMRLRIPDWIDGLESDIRPIIQKVVARGNVTLSLKVSREAGAPTQQINTAALTQTLAFIATIEEAAMAQGVNIVAPSATDILSHRGILEAQGEVAEDTGPLKSALLAQLPTLLESFNAMRAAEGRALGDILSGQVTRIAELTETAQSLCAARAGDIAAHLRTTLAKVLDNTDGADPDRVAQELALIAVKSDITEELDRLAAHVSAARDLLAQTGPVGRKFDFLTQEFNREANTLCSKSQNAALTRVGLELKTTIDQMREQVQNVE
ncbi:YicC/YloC family endoribonuclease [Oceaniglobus ichthyenteri]|uniref:YicC/YloC family endoribonuclease n=1 Tax=Oceaniglobus ichthyenteri TaxID=2136177 RepID=UPI000D3976ED|nr:YicC/YloC family endoribonuclease [Oceaniglobus ichthyenteri]